MDTRVRITAAIFAAYLKCPLKAYLMAQGEKSPETFYADIHQRISVAYKARANETLRIRSPDVLPIDFLQLICDPARDRITLFVDCETASCACDNPEFLSSSRRGRKSEAGPSYVPIRYSACDKIDQSDDLLVCFGALAIALATGTEIPLSGEVIYGEAHRRRTVRITDGHSKMRQVVEAIVSVSRAAGLPPLVLNKHCPTCDFQSRCRALAVEREALSLLGGMTPKEQSKCEVKGITTITQLSYGYRPRRRRIAPTAPHDSLPLKHDHKLKALAIKKAQTHVVGSPSLSFEGTPVFMDVEGMPDRHFYYLIGLRYKSQGIQFEKSFWADGPEGESDIWRKFLGALKEIDNPRVVHYGAHESRFLKHMRKRWKPTTEEAEFVDRVVGSSLNLLASIYGRMYFPTYTNGLKDIARWLGFNWTWPQASGAAALLLRRCWELTSDDTLRRGLVTYNIEDCRAVELVADALARICTSDEFGNVADFETVTTDSLEIGFQRPFGKFLSAVPGFENINAAAYWDYQRSKVYVRNGTATGRSIEKTAKSLTKKVIVDKEVDVDKPELCLRCGSSKLWAAGNVSRVVSDLKFMRNGIKRWTIRYRYKRYQCSACGAGMKSYSSSSKYGPNLHAYVTYLLVEMRLSLQKIAEHVTASFNVPIAKAMVSDMKSTMAKKYEPTYRRILEQIASGSLVHADETKGAVRGGGHYVWIFANMRSAAYVYSATREASILGNVLGRFKGVLVSDFYSGYDAVPCPQQKCLIHLMRDINEDVLKHPFNEELTFIATRFGTLLRTIVETIDRYGLKKRHLRKHKRTAERFLHELAVLQCTTEVASSLKKRIDKNKDKLFTFLDYDNVPWNNNNAEHAVRAFTRLRNTMCISTPKGTHEYCVLLTVQQTLRCQGRGFLDFLRSDKIEVDG